MRSFKITFFFYGIVVIFGQHNSEVNSAVCSTEKNVILKPGEVINISSPGFENNQYPVNALCFWTINSRQDPPRSISVEFISISIWPSFNCLFDGLILFDGNSSSSPIIGKYCSGTPSLGVTTTGPSLHIVFYSGEFTLRHFRGFYLSISEVEPEVPCTNEEIACHNKNCVSRQLACDGIDHCGDGTDEELCGKTLPNIIPCGITPINPSIDGEDRIVGGKSAIPGSWPWQCSLRRKNTPLYGHLCGAVLINSQWILTVAHCFRTLRKACQWSVHLGKFYKEKKDQTEQVRYIKDLYIHPKYNFERSNSVLAQTRENDIAIGKLNAPVTVTEFVRPVCLPPWRAKVAAMTLAYVTGWGDTLGTGNSDVLKQAAVPIVSKESCSNSYANILNITDKHVCAGYAEGGQDSCKGDSGGPLVVQKDNHWFLIGLVSTGRSCAVAKKPGIYTSVSFFKTWISNVI